MNNTSVNLHGYCINHVFLYNFGEIDVCEFWIYFLR